MYHLREWYSNLTIRIVSRCPPWWSSTHPTHGKVRRTARGIQTHAQNRPHHHRIRIPWCLSTTTHVKSKAPVKHYTHTIFLNFNHERLRSPNIASFSETNPEFPSSSSSFWMLKIICKCTIESIGLNKAPVDDTLLQLQPVTMVWLCCLSNLLKWHFIFIILFCGKQEALSQSFTL